MAEFISKCSCCKHLHSILKNTKTGIDEKIYFCRQGGGSLVLPVRQQLPDVKECNKFQPQEILK